MVGEFSSGLASDREFRLEKRLPGFLDHQLDLADNLKRHNIRYLWYPTPGMHEWKVWRHALAEFAQKVFRATN